MKKISSILISITAVFSVITSGVLISPDSAFASYENEINYLKTYGLIPQKLLETDSNKIITKAELYAFIVSYSENKPAQTSTVNLPFSDTDNTAWYAPYLQEAVDLGIIKTYSSIKNFEPNRQLRKREVITTLFDTFGVGVNKLFDKDFYPFTDLNASGDFAPYAYKAYLLGIIETPASSAKAAKLVTIGDAANIFYNIDQYIYVGDEGNYSITINNDGSGYSFTPTEKKLVDDQAFKVMLDVYSNIQDRYYYKSQINNKKMIYNAIDGMVQSLDDPYTVFTKPDENNAGQTLQGEYEGVGMTVELIDNKITVISPFKDSPADKAGIKPNDVITKIDGSETSGMSLEKAVELLKGKAGTTVKITVNRSGQTITFSVVRAKVIFKTAAVKFIKEGTGVIAHLEIVTFANTTLQEFNDAVKEIVDRQATSKDVKGIIIDLRNNPGGYLDETIEMTGEFFKDSKTIVILEDKNGKRISYASNGGGKLADYKTVVLINGGSASASEIMAGALKDLGKAKIIGEKSYGKGSVQEFSAYKDGSTFKLTVSKWFTPNGTSINKVGITPDVIVAASKTTDAQLDAAIKELKF